MARPKKIIKQKQFESLCALQCTREEICGILEVSEKTLDKWCHETYETSFSLIFREKKQLGKMSLRRSQFKLSEKNATMAIWLGKQLLGQKDNPLEIVQDNDNTKEPKITKDTPPTEAAKIYARMVKK